MNYVICKDRIMYIGDMVVKNTYYGLKANEIYLGPSCKTADTIEELCDGLIVEEKDNPQNWFVMEISEYQSMDNADKKHMFDRWNFHAFIKTDKGLIYVAEPNDKGGLELL